MKTIPGKRRPVFLPIGEVLCVVLGLLGAWFWGDHPLGWVRPLLEGVAGSGAIALPISLLTTPPRLKWAARLLSVGAAVLVAGLLTVWWVAYLGGGIFLAGALTRVRARIEGSPA